MSDGALAATEALSPTPEQLREMNILIKAQNVIPDYFTTAIHRASASLSGDDSDADDAEQVWESFLNDLEIEMARRTQ